MKKLCEKIFIDKYFDALTRRFNCDELIADTFNLYLKRHRKILGGDVLEEDLKNLLNENYYLNTSVKHDWEILEKSQEELSKIKIEQNKIILYTNLNNV